MGVAMQSGMEYVKVWGGGVKIRGWENIYKRIRNIRKIGSMGNVRNLNLENVKGVNGNQRESIVGGGRGGGGKTPKGIHSNK